MVVHTQGGGSRVMCMRSYIEEGGSWWHCIWAWASDEGKVKSIAHYADRAQALRGAIV